MLRGISTATASVICLQLPLPGTVPIIHSLHLSSEYNQPDPSHQPLPLMLVSASPGLYTSKSFRQSGAAPNSPFIGKRMLAPEPPTQASPIFSHSSWTFLPTHTPQAEVFWGLPSFGCLPSAVAVPAPGISTI